MLGLVICLLGYKGDHQPSVALSACCALLWLAGPTGRAGCGLDQHLLHGEGVWSDLGSIALGE